MARGNNQAQTAANSAQGISNQSSANAGSIYGSLAPELTSEMTNPQGFNPTTVAGMKTENMQGAGGAEAGAVGQGGLMAARTRNAGGSDAATAASAKSAGQTLGKENLGVDLANEQLKQQQRNQATSGLEGLYGTNTGASINSLGEVASNVNANSNAAGQSWDWSKYLLDPALQAGGTALAGLLSR